MTFCGIPQIMAPEQLLNQEYGTEIGKFLN